MVDTGSLVLVVVLKFEEIIFEDYGRNRCKYNSVDYLISMLLSD